MKSLPEFELQLVVYHNNHDPSVEYRCVTAMGSSDDDLLYFIICIKNILFQLI